MNIKEVIIMQYKTIDNNNENYKIVSSDNLEFCHEQGIDTFKLFSAFQISINDELYYLPYKELSNGRFGEVLSVTEILKDERISEEEKESVIDISKKDNEMRFLLNINHQLEFFHGENIVKSQTTIPFNQNNLIEDDKILSPTYAWYIEFTKKGDKNVYLKPTFYSDKRYRFDPEIERYRFVKVAKFKKLEQEHTIVVEREDWQLSLDNYHRDEVDDAIDASISYIAGAEQQKLFEGYTRLYPFNSEDSSAVFRINKEFIENGDVCTITGSGDALLDLYYNGAKSVTCFDINGNAKFLAKLKFLFIKAGITYKEYVTFFGASVQDFSDYLDTDIYNKYSHNLDYETKKYWDSIIRYLQINNLNLKKNKNTLFYDTYDAFSGLFYNATFNAPSSYLENEESFKRLQVMLENKTLNDCDFKDASLFQIHEILKDRQYSYVYLSNVLDFADYFFGKENEIENKKTFKEFVMNNLVKIVLSDGLLDVAYIKNTWTVGGTQGVMEVFKISDGFILKSLSPYCKDYVLSLPVLELEKNFENKGLSQ